MKLANWSGFTDISNTCSGLRLHLRAVDFSGYSPDDRAADIADASGHNLNGSGVFKFPERGFRCCLQRHGSTRDGNDCRRSYAQGKVNEAAWWL
jgi:hypothetical protein